MERMLVSEQELLRILNEELKKVEDSEGYRFGNGVLRLTDTDEDGCNWSTVYLRGSGVPVELMAATAARIVTEARKKYNIR
jgi:hypothetical protein